ncbi:MAG: VWA domain-containing protein [Gemmatimonadaceae bacterium]|nr:VWA domain-containing protein [Gemmatimonadaceae bacterium]
MTGRDVSSARRRRAFALPLLFVTLGLAACLDEGVTGAGVDVPAVASVSVSGVRLDAAQFRQSGEFALGILAIDEAGDIILDERTDLTLTLQQQQSPEVPPLQIIRRQTERVEPNASTTRAAILLDNSGSMSTSDPTRLRAAAARLFWEAIFAASPSNAVSMLDFGQPASVGFVDTRLLQSWTSDPALLTAQLPRIQPSGGTPLYGSLFEVMRWIDTTGSANTNRVVLLLSDGAPTDASRRTAVLQSLPTRNITVHTVGLGSASDLSPSASTSAVTAMREIADASGGVYAAATDAAALGQIFNVLASASSRGQLISRFQVVPVPPSGTTLRGLVLVNAGGRVATASWSFVAP